MKLADLQYNRVKPLCALSRTCRAEHFPNDMVWKIGECVKGIFQHYG